MAVSGAAWGDYGLGDSGRRGSDPGRCGSDPGRRGSDPGRRDSDLGRRDSDPGRCDSDPGRRDSDPGRCGSDPGRSVSDPRCGSFTIGIVAEGYGRVRLPDVLVVKYPGAPLEWGWQYIFLAEDRSKDPGGGRAGLRHHGHERRIQRVFRQRLAGRGLPSRRRFKPCATVSRRTCCRMVMTSAPCRSCWATRV
jgi:hypothetical protein